MASSQELGFEVENQIHEEENMQSIQQEQQLQNNYFNSNLEDRRITNYFTKCGDILVKNGEFLINCCFCEENFANFHNFSMHYNNFHENYNISISTEKNCSNLISFNHQHHLNDKLEESFSEISTQSEKNFTEKIFDESDVEVIEIGECKYTVKKISSREDLCIQNTKETQLNTQENEKRKFEFCPECNKLFPNSNDLKEHITNYHEKERPFECEQCGKKFRLRESLNEHVRSIHEKILPFKCEFCNRGFFKSSALKIHIRDHTGERPFICETCQKSFKSKGALNEHTFIHTGAKRYACQYCNKEFLHSSSLKKHERIHTGERPYTCEKCNSSFRTLDVLKEHLRLHGGEKPYKCRFCNAQFSQRVKLTGHYRIHKGLDQTVKNGRRPCKCEICDKVLSRKYNLRTHLRKTHRLLNSQVEEIMNNLNEPTGIINKE